MEDVSFVSCEMMRVIPLPLQTLSSKVCRFSWRRYVGCPCVDEWSTLRPCPSSQVFPGGVFHSVPLRLGTEVSGVAFIRLEKAPPYPAIETLGANFGHLVVSSFKGYWGLWVLRVYSEHNMPRGC